MGQAQPGVTAALVTLNFIVMVVLVALAARLLAHKRLRSYPNWLYSAFLLSLAAFVLPSFFFLVTRYDRVEFTSNSALETGSSGGCKAQSEPACCARSRLLLSCAVLTRARSLAGFLLTFFGNTACVIHYHLVGTLHLLCTGAKPLLKSRLLSRVVLGAVVALAWALVVYVSPLFQ